MSGMAAGTPNPDFDLLGNRGMAAGPAAAPNQSPRNNLNSAIFAPPSPQSIGRNNSANNFASNGNQF